MLPVGDTYEDISDRFEWRIPEHYNIGVDVCDKWATAEPERLAITHVDENGAARDYSFAELAALSNRLANLLKSLGVERGERVAILLPQVPETAVGHIAVYKIGAIAIPLFTLFGVDALVHRLSDSGARAILTNAEGVEKLGAIRDRLPDLEIVLSVDGSEDDVIDLYEAIEQSSDRFTPVETRAEDPALIIYTSGTTGPPKGALHAHRVLLGHLPGVEISHDLFPQPGDKIWTPADWAWIGGLLDVLMPALHHGIGVVARRFEKFTPEAAFELISEHGVRNAFIPPTALKMMRTVENPRERWSLNMRTIASGGETLGSELLDWGRGVFGLTINEFYGQTECNMVVSSCAAIMEERPGIMGRPVPGHELAVLDEKGRALPPGEIGTIAVQRPDPVMLLNYWNNEQATAEKFIGDWLLTGDTGVWEDEGWIRFIGRDDDVITSAGYRIGPGEIEDCLIRHPAVQLAGVVGKPDPDRTEIVKAYIVLNEGFTPHDELSADIREFVKVQLSAHEYPREIDFVDSLPLTTTGKIIRGELRERARSELEPTG